MTLVLRESNVVQCIRSASSNQHTEVQTKRCIQMELISFPAYLHKPKPFATMQETEKPNFDEEAQISIWAMKPIFECSGFNSHSHSIIFDNYYFHVVRCLRMCVRSWSHSNIFWTHIHEPRNIERNGMFSVLVIVCRWLAFHCMNACDDFSLWFSSLLPLSMSNYPIYHWTHE